MGATASKLDIYQGSDPREIPLYSVSEAARYLCIPPSTLRNWVSGLIYPVSEGESYFEPLIPVKDRQSPRLSFLNLIEAHVLRSLRAKHSIPLGKIREAIQNAESLLNVKRLLMREELRTYGEKLLLDQVSELVDLNAGGQLALKKMLEAGLRRVHYEKGLPSILYPLVPGLSEGKGNIIIDPRISFGRPVTERRNISTDVIADRYNVGETIQQLAGDYGLDEKEIEEAIIYSQAA